MLKQSRVVKPAPWENVEKKLHFFVLRWQSTLSQLFRWPDTEIGSNDFPVLRQDYSNDFENQLRCKADEKNLKETQAKRRKWNPRDN